MNIAIVGYGLEGKANYEYFSKRGHCLTIVDEREKIEDLPEDAHVILGAYAFSQLSGFDMIVRTAGVAPYKLSTDVKIWSSTNEFFAQCTTPIIGVTGSKGKGTTASFIAEILRASGKKVELLGNIGRPALEALDEANAADVVVYELSSFQLWDLQRSPSTAVVLHIEPDHLDVHASFEEYLEAKSHIVMHMSAEDEVYVHPTNPHAHAIVSQTAATVRKYNDSTEAVSYVQDGMFYRHGKELCSTDVVALPGAHNLENACAAIAAVSSYDVPDEAVVKGLRAFTGLPHRLKFVREVDGVKYYDDSIATTPGSAIAAVRAFSQPKILILGGSHKGAEYAELARKIAAANVKKMILIGEEASRLEEALVDVAVPYVLLRSTTMSQIVEECSVAAEEGDIVILSPAAASFDMFASYSDRGDQFIAAVNEL